MQETMFAAAWPWSGIAFAVLLVAVLALWAWDEGKFRR